MNNPTPFDAAAATLATAHAVAAASAINLADTILTLHEAGVLEVAVPDESVRDFEQMIADHREALAAWRAASEATLGALHT